MSAARAFFVLSLVFSSSGFSAKQLALKLVGAVGNKIITDRDVQASSLVDRALYGDGLIQPAALGTEEFSNALNRLLIEWIVFQEANTFGVAKVTDPEVDQGFQHVKAGLSGLSDKNVVTRLGLSDSLLKEMVLRKLKANRFIKYKTNSSYVQVSDEEAREYFEKNRLKFGTMDFDAFKGNIKKFLSSRNAEDRLKDWFNILRTKHRVKNLLTEGSGAHAISPSQSN